MKVAIDTFKKRFAEITPWIRSNGIIVLIIVIVIINAVAGVVSLSHQNALQRQIEANAMKQIEAYRDHEEAERKAFEKQLVEMSDTLAKIKIERAALKERVAKLEALRSQKWNPPVGLDNVTKRFHEAGY